MGRQSLGLGEQVETRADELYVESLRHFQRGEWKKAIAGFEEVLKLCPDDTHTSELLDQARLKASLDRARPRAKRTWARRLLRALSRGVFCVIIGLALATATVWVRSRWLQPVRASQQEAKQWAEQLAQAQTYLAELQYAAAGEAFRALLAEAPEDEQARAGLLQVEKQMALVNTYAQAKDALARHDWNEALRLLGELSAVDPDYTDVRQQQAFVQEQQHLEAQFETAEEAYYMGDWTTAMDAYEALIEADPSFQRQVVAEHLCEAYIGQGVELVEESRGTSQAVQHALSLFRKALVLKPQYPPAVREVALAEKYLEAQALLDQGNLDGALAALDWLERQRALYAGGKAAALLRAAKVADSEGTALEGEVVSESISVGHVVQLQYAGLVEQGDQAKAAGDHTEAERCYREAMAIGIPWSLTPYVRMAALYAKRGDHQQAVETTRVALLILQDSQVASPSSSHWDHIEQGERNAQDEDYVKALAQFDIALRAIAQQCDCGLEDWRVLP